MNPFVVSARKYRPATFDTVVGQAHITNTLKNAIRTNHLAQAFLFCGPRGVGKTTCARILAKTMNCRHVSPETEACNTCESCLSFNNGQSLNIYELDAASNNSVDDIRGLVEQVRYAPHAGEYKIYIIDEVHMLSTSAFNAFLKTLEEPPSYAIFILATTEKHKIIPTILSRCQIFDFNRIEVDDIASHLAHVARQEGVNAEEEALHIIAQKADGALRDALSIFDQIVSFAGTTIRYKDVISNLSILDYDYYFSVTDSICAGDIPTVLLTFNKLLIEGFDGHQFINGLASHFRDLLVSKDTVTLPLLEVSKNTRERYREQAGNIATGHLLKFLAVCSQCDIDYRMAKNQRLHVELALLRLCSITGQTNATAAPIEKKTPVENASELPRTVPTAAQVKSETVSTVTPSPELSVPESRQHDDKLEIIEAPVHVPIHQTDAPPAAQTEQASTGTLNQATPFLRARSMTQLSKPAAPEKATTKLPADLPATTFSHEELMTAWNAYAESMKLAGKLQLYTTITHTTPELKGTEITLEVQNHAQEEMVTEESVHLLETIRKKLNNYSIVLRTRLAQQATDPESAYTNREKYQKLAEKHPGLDDFRKQLGLELEL
ncbi:MAG: DNA polymerase III subunit gamma/tau [Bacteroidota bacterium]|jgi:DNA polymerase-3 subunit gamma/tau